MKFKSAINKLTASELRLAPLGRDTDGQVYWAQQDSSLNIRIYQEDEEEQTWNLVVKYCCQLKLLMDFTNDFISTETGFLLQN